MFGEPHFPQIEIIRTGREKRKSENVSEGSYASNCTDPHLHPFSNLHIHPSICAASLLCFMETAAADMQREGADCVCVV